MSGIGGTTPAASAGESIHQLTSQAVSDVQEPSTSVDAASTENNAATSSILGERPQNQTRLPRSVTFAGLENSSSSGNIDNNRASRAPSNTLTFEDPFITQSQQGFSQYPRGLPSPYFQTPPGFINQSSAGRSSRGGRASQQTQSSQIGRQGGVRTTRERAVTRTRRGLPYTSPLDKPVYGLEQQRDARPVPHVRLPSVGSATRGSLQAALNQIEANISALELPPVPRPLTDHEEHQRYIDTFFEPARIEAAALAILNDPASDINRTSVNQDARTVLHDPLSRNRELSSGVQTSPNPQSAVERTVEQIAEAERQEREAFKDLSKFMFPNDEAELHIDNDRSGKVAPWALSKEEKEAERMRARQPKSTARPRAQASSRADELDAAVKWFDQNPTAGQINMVRAMIIHPSRRAAPTQSYQPSPIGHGRPVSGSSMAVPADVAAAANALVTLSESATENVTAAINPLRESNTLFNNAAMAAMTAGTITSLHDQYANAGRQYFAPYGQPPEWAIDHSATGNQSMFGGDWGQPPQRVGRDPRYRTTMHEGRPTYFEDMGPGSGFGARGGGQ